MSDRSKPRLDDAIDKLPRDISPTSDLWPGIERAIALDKKAVATTAHPRMLAAFVTAAAFLGWLLLPQRVPQPEPSIPVWLTKMEQQHQQQVGLMKASLQQQTPLLPDWQQQLDELDRAAEHIRAALQQDPENAALIRLLQSVYQQQLWLLERVHAPEWHHA